MRKAKAILALVLTAAVLFAMAVLPRAAEALDDAPQSGTAPIQPVSLDIREDDTMLRRLALQARMTTIPVSPESAAMTTEEVLAAAWAGLQIYFDTGIMDYFEATDESAEPYLGVDPSDKSNYAVFWSVVLSDGQQSVLLHLDDETGKILLFIYDNYESNLEFAENGGQQLMQKLAHAFLTPLSLHPSQTEEMDDLVGNVATEETPEESGRSKIYTYQFTPCGTLRVGFNISTTGAYVYFPE